MRYIDETCTKVVPLDGEQVLKGCSLINTGTAKDLDIPVLSMTLGTCKLELRDRFPKYNHVLSKSGK